MRDSDSWRFPSSLGAGDDASPGADLGQRGFRDHADIVGILPNESAVRGLVGAPLMKRNDEYAIQTRPIPRHSAATMAPVSEHLANGPLTAPALASAQEATGTDESNLSATASYTNSVDTSR